MAKSKKPDYPLRLCSGCAAEYADGGFTVEYAEPRSLIGGRKCDFCGKALPVYACRISGRGKPKREK